MSGWYALVVDARKSFVVVDIDDNDEQDAFWHMKPSLGIWKRKFHQKPFIQNFSFILRFVIMITIITIEPQIGWKDKIKDIFFFWTSKSKIWSFYNCWWIIIDSEREKMRNNVLVLKIIT